MIRLIRSRILPEGVDRAAPPCPRRTPSKIPKINHQIRRHPVSYLIKLFWPEDFRSNRLTVLIRDCFEITNQLSPKTLIFRRFYNPSPFATPHVHPNPRIIPNVNPQLPFLT